MVGLMKVKMTRMVANLPAVATYGGSKKHYTFISLSAPATIATSFLKIREKSSYKEFVETGGSGGTPPPYFQRSANDSTSACPRRTSASVGGKKHATI